MSSHLEDAPTKKHQQTEQQNHQAVNAVQENAAAKRKAASVEAIKKAVNAVAKTKPANAAEANRQPSASIKLTAAR